MFFLYNYDSTQTYTKLKIYNYETPKYSKDMVFLKVPQVSEFLRLGFRLFHSIIVDGKEKLLKNL